MGLMGRFTLAVLLMLCILQEEAISLSQAKVSAPLHPSKRSMGVIGQQRAQLQNNMVFYMHDWPGVTSMVVAAQNNNLGPPSKLGRTHIFDNKLTDRPNPKSTEIGRGQGLYTLASVSNFDSFMVFTAVLHKPVIYNGSTICLHGADRSLPEREIAIVGGTGHFRFVRGYAIISTASFIAPNATLKFNLTMHQGY
eukprot:c1848_g1_i1 orf=265-849(-)